jgi:metal-dependent amidase/aminoacylase/carboxypeptidase family protein
MPHQTVDPVLLATHVVVRLQNIVSREVDPSDLAVVTVGSLQAGQTEIIADRAEIGIDFRTVKLETRQKILSAIQRIVEAECKASGSPKPPLITPTRRFPPTSNDRHVASQLAVSFGNHFEDFDGDTPRTNVSEDFSTLGTSQGLPCSFWLIGGVEPELWDKAQRIETLMEEIPGNHSALFAPVIQPTMKTGVDALCIAALTFLRK